MKKLVRTRVERFDVLDARKLCQIQMYADMGKIEAIVLPVDRMFDDYPPVKTTAVGDRLIHNGNAVPEAMFQEFPENQEERKKFRVYDSENKFVGIFEKKGELISPVKMFYAKDAE